MKQKFYRPDQVAQHFGVTTQTIYNWIYEGKLPAYKVGNKILRIREDDLGEMPVKPITETIK